MHIIYQSMVFILTNFFILLKTTIKREESTDENWQEWYFLIDDNFGNFSTANNKLQFNIQDPQGNYLWISR